MKEESKENHCKRCSGKLVVRFQDPFKKVRKSYYKKWLVCSRCSAVYYDKHDLVIVEQKEALAFNF